MCVYMCACVCVCVCVLKYVFRILSALSWPVELLPIATIADWLIDSLMPRGRTLLRQEISSVVVMLLWLY